VILTGLAYRCERFVKAITCAIKTIEVYQLKNTRCENLDLNIMSSYTLKITDRCGGDTLLSSSGILQF
jgi:hypothetical protein